MFASIVPKLLVEGIRLRVHWTVRTKACQCMCGCRLYRELNTSRKIGFKCHDADFRQSVYGSDQALIRLKVSPLNSQHACSMRMLMFINRRSTA